MFSGLNNFFKNFLPKGLFYRSLIIVAAPTILLQLIVTVVFFDSIWIKANKGMTRSLVGEIKTLSDVYNSDNKNQINYIGSFPVMIRMLLWNIAWITSKLLLFL